MKKKILKEKEESAEGEGKEKEKEGNSFGEMINEK